MSSLQFFSHYYSVYIKNYQSLKSNHSFLNTLYSHNVKHKILYSYDAKVLIYINIWRCMAAVFWCVPCNTLCRTVAVSNHFSPATGVIDDTTCVRCIQLEVIWESYWPTESSKTMKAFLDNVKRTLPGVVWIHTMQVMQQFA